MSIAGASFAHLRAERDFADEEVAAAKPLSPNSVDGLDDLVRWASRHSRRRAGIRHVSIPKHPAKHATQPSRLANRIAARRVRRAKWSKTRR